MNNIRSDFPLLQDSMNNKPLIYFDNAATTQKPQAVIDAVKDHYCHANANPNRGTYDLSVLATDRFEAARKAVVSFIHAPSDETIIFTRGTTESINLIAYSYARKKLQPGDEILISILEHHANLVPWQQVCKETGAVLKYVYLNENYEITLSAVKAALSEKTKIVAITHASNVLGTITPIEEIAAAAHEKGALCVVDAAQSIPHKRVDVQKLDCDFLAFSAHKMYAPAGMGVLYGKKEIMESMEPFLSGGDMIEYVDEQSTTFAPLPRKFEAGTQNVEGAVGLHAAIDYIQKIGIESIIEKEKGLTAYAVEKLLQLEHVHVYGSKQPQRMDPIISFGVSEVHAHDVATILNQDGIAVRAGFHCAQPLMKYLNIRATCRVSFSFYNTKEEIDQFIQSVSNVRKVMGYGS